jgi:hypothetical protein
MTQQEEFPPEEGRSNRAGTRRIPFYPLWATVAFTLMVAIIVPVYWVEYGPQNFLWFSDIALFLVLLSLWTGNRLLYSMMAVGVLPLEIVWTLDFLAGGALGGLAGYMFDEAYPLWLRALSLFHIPLWITIVWMLFRQGYHPGALVAQTLLAWIVLPLTWWLTDVESNINWVHGLGPGGEQFLQPAFYLAVYMVLLPLVVFLPMHLLLRKLCVARADS